MALLAPASERTGIGTDTVASRARDWARRAPHQVAMREKDFGIWQREHVGPRSGSDRARRRPRAAGARGRRPATGSRSSREDRPEWVILDLATVAVRGDHGRPVPDQPGGRGRVPARRLRRQGAPRRGPGAGRQGARRSTARGCPTCARSSTSSRAGCRTYDDDRLMFWDDFLELGRQHRAEHPDAVDATGWPRPTADDVMTLVYTSGTTGPPKGAMLTNTNAAFCIEQDRQLARRVCPVGSRRTRRPDRHVPAAVPRRRADLLDLDARRLRHRCSTSPSRSTPSTRTSARCSRRSSSPCPGSGRSSTPVVADQGQRRHLVQAQVPRFGLRPRRSGSARHEGRQRRQPHRLVAGSCYALGWPLVFRALQRADRPAPLPVRRRPGRRRSPPRCSSSSSASASRSSSSTA